MKETTLALLSLFISLNAHAAATDQQIINQQNQILQRQQQFEVAKERQTQLKEVAKEQQKIQEEESMELDIGKAEVIQDFSKIQCFEVLKIEFSENKILKKSEEKFLTKNYVHKCLATEQIIELKKEINDYLIEQGYVTSRAVIPMQNLSDGILKIEILESYLEKVIFNEDKFFDKTQKFTAFGFSENEKVLNLKKFEQGLDQINRLPSNSAALKILPGNKINNSIIAIENHPQNTSRINATYDNYGSASTGENRDTISFAQDNLLHLNDSLNLSRTANDLDQNMKKGHSNSFNSTFSVPFTWYNLTLSFAQSSYGLLAKDEAHSKIWGTTTTKSIGFDRVLIKNNKFKIAGNFLLTNRYNQNFNGDVKIDDTSRKLSTASFALPLTIFLQDSTLFLKPNFLKSATIFDAKKDSRSLPSNAAHSEFEIFKFYGNYSKKAVIPYLETPTYYNLTFDSQASKQKLYGIDQFSVGGIYSVRGFKEGSIANDSGYNIKNEFTLNLGQTILPHLNLEQMPESLKYLNNFSLTPFYDYGYIRSKGGDQSGRLSGAGFKTSFNHKNFSASLTFSWAISKSQHLLQNNSENNAIYFDVNSELGFF